MPRLSARGKKIRELYRILERRGVAAVSRELLSDPDSSADELDAHWQSEYDLLLSSRYVDRPNKYRRRSDRWRKLLYDHDYMNATEFHDHFRLDRDVFFRLVALVKHDSAFCSKGSKPFRGGPELHMLTLLKFLGTYGNDNTAVKLGLFLGIASGSVHNYFFRATNVVLKLEPVTMAWPNEEERVMISLRMQQKYGFVNCVGITDGTLFPLAAKPQHQGEDYFSRKASYSVHGLVTCDDVGRVRSLVVGWPGSTHDNRAWMNSPLILKRADHFKHNEYVLGDSAFQASSVMIPAFKNPPKAQMNPRHTYFNKQLAKARIKSEHCIGLLKMRFPYLREIRVKLGKKRKHIRRLIRHVTFERAHPGR
ncbi:uncharacterized protein PITG_10549 [Phytophthora infestans T30-4]|uniref:DDE Tnp4 domain-containing protein n=1 Tax=Phytophthora infestans (strain T30-4) TaxID=403677 RepID=D0NFK9_PHYIT|nr:uncharacterized protein PITG_10549 [Phytophthora infestans T30-4]EEY56998.1 conserved hypothetical protein [Phytophthora infestans T30-4]|eukprot:XP_002902326.1 conserved hypothetical protein [Phytophthora infestans T30-4]